MPPIRISALRSGGIPAAKVGDEDVAAPSHARPRCGNIHNDSYNRPGGDVTRMVSAERDSAIIKVEDTGVGIPAEKQEPICERFARLDKSRRTEHHNFGLGLAITWSIMRAHEGRVAASSEMGKGGVFRISLPLVAG